jgi:hypothetical protein
MHEQESAGVLHEHLVWLGSMSIWLGLLFEDLWNGTKSNF